MELVRREWMPTCSMKRVVVHWTAGAYRASAIDRAHYHLLVEGDGAVVRGLHSIQTNAAAQEPRASHTRNCNTVSIGIAVCCMENARERPFDPGPFPMTLHQWNTMAQVVAELCHRYGIRVSARTVLAHGEVQSTLGIPQSGKWDPVVLPWAPTQDRPEVMDTFRDRVRQHVTVLQARQAGAPNVTEQAAAGNQL